MHEFCDRRHERGATKKGEDQRGQAIIVQNCPFLSFPGNMIKKGKTRIKMAKFSSRKGFSMRRYNIISFRGYLSYFSNFS